MTGRVWQECLKRVILRRRSTAEKLLLTLAGLAIAGGLRWALDRGAYGVPFLTFFPVILLTALCLGCRYALLAGVGAVATAWALFVPGSIRLAEPSVQAAIIALYAVIIGLIVGTGHFIRLILIENQRHIELADSFNAELQHRAKNSLQVLRGLIGRGPASGEDAAEFHAKLIGRMEALARANELLRYGSAESTSLSELVTTALAAFDMARFRCVGPDCVLDRSAATPLVMALHELATNALKHGSLSRDGGRVALTWQPASGGRVALEWRELDGPPVAPPRTRGMGARLLRAHGGLTSIATDWDPAGIICRIEVVAEAGGQTQRDGSSSRSQ